MTPFKSPLAKDSDRIFDRPFALSVCRYERIQRIEDVFVAVFCSELLQRLFVEPLEWGAGYEFIYIIDNDDSSC
jgi:hypothetical protein